MIFSPASYSFKETIKKYRVKDKIPKHKKKDTIKDTIKDTKKYLAKLKETEKIKRLGSRKNGIWQVVEGK